LKFSYDIYLRFAHKVANIAKRLYGSTLFKY
jgi:hypothetical protein